MNLDLYYIHDKKIGFLFVTLDLTGYKRGSMNATIQKS